jgi:hypothetical protein
MGPRTGACHQRRPGGRSRRHPRSGGPVSPQCSQAVGAWARHATPPARGRPPSLRERGRRGPSGRQGPAGRGVCPDPRARDCSGARQRPRSAAASRLRAAHGEETDPDTKTCGQQSHPHGPPRAGPRSRGRGSHVRIGFLGGCGTREILTVGSSQELLLVVHAIDLARRPSQKRHPAAPGCCTRAAGNREGELSGFRPLARGWTSPSDRWRDRPPACRGTCL